MQASSAQYDDDVRNEVSHYRAILKQRTRYYLAQRDAGVPMIGAAILDLVILGNLEGCFMDIESVADVMCMPRPAARQEIVELIREEWLEVQHSPDGAGLHATEKAAGFAEQWIGIANSG